MEGIVTQIINNKKGPGELKKFLDSNLEKISKNSKYLNNSLQALDSKINTLGFIYILYAKTKGKIDTGFVQHTEKLFENMDSTQAHYGGNELRVVVKRYFDVVMATKDYSRGMNYLRSGLLQFRPTENHLTPFHAYLLCLCLKSKNFKYAEQFVNAKIFDIEPPKTGITPTEFLLYYYYGGMIHTGLKNYKKALYFFETALTLPAFSLNAIMLESYKKYVLVSLIEYGKFNGSPKKASNIVSRNMKKVCSPYCTFAELYTAGNNNGLNEHLVKFTELFVQEQNMGLVKQCLSVFAKKTILKLQETYLTISTKQLVSETKLKNEEEVEALLLSMVENGEISVSINQKEKMVTFVEEIDVFDKSETGLYLEDKINTTMKLFDRLKLMDEEIGLTKKYNARLLGVREETQQNAPKGNRRRGPGATKLFF